MRRAIAALRRLKSSRFSSRGSVAAGVGKKIPASRPLRVTRMGSREPRRPVALSRNSADPHVVTTVAMMARGECGCRRSAKGFVYPSGRRC